MRVIDAKWNKPINEEIAELQDQIKVKEEEIHAQLFKKTYPITRVSFGEWDSKHIVHSILAEK